MSDAREPADEIAALDGLAQPEEAGARGLRAITAEQFSLSEAVGGVRGLVESVAPGLLFVVVYLVAGQQLAPALIAAAGAALVAVVVRLAQRTPATQAFSGLLGVAIGVFWAWRSGQAEDYFVYGILTNAAYLVGCLASVVAGWPVVGVVVGMLSSDGPLGGGPWSKVGAWRSDRALRRRYSWATWAWVAMFAARLAVQVPLYLAGQVAWLGTAKLAMGIPLTALVLWFSWLLVRGSGSARAPARPRHDS
ncbi:DUF3159 domain-containing protein [Cellulomonas chengniuliangii]|uniref:DUF3159 domain-containing protein n=1 Tax=Cellulomonas chengniuliangii TaxID=2968084 RepID=A0ABY5KTZ1_9CELL|nr:DUF3159 domain-containing protein [Cellulomonas chengniuliangii]MCC2308568.1 DUF3159 domain-containing protein [Cellulomonas chengniuliangii]MCC2317585.1 DUF3159 domain-containing protein [Cellulomonas chengniuliangii]UUI73932.1 DUF3159 domain-containing protein [Cellulomonas chengniuliangii]